MQAASGKAQTGNLNVVITEIKTYDSRAEFNLVLKNEDAERVSVSRFDLVGAIRAAKLSDIDGNSWRVARTKNIEHPPAPEVDFSFKIDAGGTNGLTIITRPIEKLAGKGVTQSRPGKMNYEITREIGTIRQPSGKFRWAVCKGSGTVGIEWLGSKQSLGK